MEFADVVRRRRMVRAFSKRPIPDEVLDRLLRVALSAPSAGNSQGLELVVLNGPAETARYWDVSLPPERRDRFPWPGLLDAPVLVVLVERPGAYVDRYAEDDKANSGLGAGEDVWPVPYWYVDGGMGAGLLLLAAVDEGLGALFFGLFEQEADVMRALGIPADHRPVGVVALGHPDDSRDRTSRSAQRTRRPVPDSVHRGGW